MSKPEQAVRDAAASLHAAIVAARAAGLAVTWPLRFDDLPAIAISETAKTAVSVQVQTPGDIPDEAVAKAVTVAQKAAEKVVEKEKAKA